MNPIELPTNIRAHQAEQVLELAWPDDRVDRLPYRHIRANCPCATCRDEWTGERILDPATIRPDLKLEGMEAIGNYAVRLVWSDGHSSGLYTWETLRTLADLPQAQPGTGEGGKWRGLDPPMSGQYQP
jgi:DUF971 family protein